MRLRLIGLGSCLTLGAGSEGQAQNASPAAEAVSSGPRVDTTQRVIRDVVALWRAYLTSARPGARPNPYWSASEQAAMPQFDLVGSSTYSSASFRHRYRAVVSRVEPLGSDAARATMDLRRPESDGQLGFVVHTIFQRRGGPPSDQYMTRVHVVRENDRWVLSNPLMYHTQGWHAVRVGRIVYTFPPTQSFDTTRAVQASRFLDSLATTYGTRLPSRLLYVMTGSDENMGRVLGIDGVPSGADFSGISYIADALLISGSAARGEFHGHELAHFVFVPLLPTGDAVPLISEGAAVWAGGSQNREYEDLAHELANELRSRPDLTLTEILRPNGKGRQLGYLRIVAGALLCELAFQRRGVVAVRTLLQARAGDDLVQVAERALGTRDAKLEEVWRAALRVYEDP